MRRVKDRRTLDDGRYVEVRFDSNPYQQYARTVRFLRRLWPGRAKPKRDCRPGALGADQKGGRLMTLGGLKERARELAPSTRGDLVSTSAIVGVAGPSAGGFLEPRMTGLQPLLELDRHKHAHLTCLIDP
jgi:hypothetical protein